MRHSAIPDMDVSMENNLSDNQRRTICRVLFLLVCALPTFVTVYFATHRRSASDWAQLLQAEIGVETYIAVVETPRPDEMIFHDVKLFDNDGDVIFESLKAKVTLGNINRIKFRDPIRMNREGLSHFLDEASGRIVKSKPDSKPWEVIFETVEIAEQEDPNFQSQPFHLQNIHVAIGNGYEGRQVTVSAAELGEIKLVRASTNGQYTVEVNTKDREVPCWLADHWYPDLKGLLGSQSKFKGVALIYSSESSSTSAVSGRFDRIDLPHMPEVDSRLVKAARSIFVDDLVLKDKTLLGGEAALMLDGNRQFDLKPWFAPQMAPDETPFHEIFRRAFREDSRTSVTRW